MKRKLLMLNIVIVAVLAASISSLTVTSSSISDFDPICDVDFDGDIDIKDVAKVSKLYGALGDPANLCVLGCSYVVYRNGSNYHAKNGTTGVLESCSTNASIVIQYAIDHSTGGDIKIRRAEYAIDTTITVDSYTKLFAEKGTTFFGTSSSMTLIAIVSSQHVEIAGLRILNDNNNLNVAISIWDSDNVYIHDVEFDGYEAVSNVSSNNIFIYSNAPRGSTCDCVTIENVYSVEGGNKRKEYGAIQFMNRTVGLKVLDSTFINSKGGSVVVVDHGADIEISNNYMNHSAPDCDGIDIINVTGAVITNNIILWQGSIGISIEKVDAAYPRMLQKIAIVSNEVGFNAGTGIYLGNAGLNVEEIVVSSNMVFCNGQSKPFLEKDRAGILLYDISYALISGNQVLDRQPVGKQTQQYGIYEYGTAADYNVIVGNICGGYSGGIKVTGSHTRVNHCYDNGTWID